jgi:thiamine pyrophosphokinase
MGTVVIFAGGDIPPREVLADLPTPDLVVAADGGHHSAQALDVKVDVLVGDLDSVQGSLPDHVLIERHPTDKEATDLELAMELVLRDWPERIVVVGGAGGRVDHEIATATMLCSSRWAGIDEIDWMSGRGRAHVVRGRRRLHGDMGQVVSLIPFGGPAEEVRTTGLRWELDGETLEPGTTRGVSNILAAPVAEVSVGRGVVLVVFPSQPARPEGIEGSSFS